MKEKQANFEFSWKIALFNFYLIFAKAVKLQEERTSKHRVAQIQARKIQTRAPYQASRGTYLSNNIKL